MKGSTLKEYKLLKSFINSEFFFQNNKYVNNYVSKQYFLQKNLLTVLDPVVHLKEIKQLIRFLQLLKKNDFPSLQIVVKNPQFDFLVYDFIKKNFNGNVRIENFLNSDLKKDVSYSRFVLLLDCFLNKESDFFHKLNNSGFSLIYKVNSQLEKSFFQNYKIHSNIDSVKKLIFLLIIIKQILKSK